MKKKVNYYKIGALILMMVEIGIALFIDRDLVKSDITTWRLYCACILFIPVNVMFIGAKRVVKSGKTK